MTFRITGLEHIQLAMPSGGEALARSFYSDIFGLNEVSKPAALAERRGCWFEAPGVKLHLGVEEDFRPARKAHPALVIEGMAQLKQKLRAAGWDVQEADPFEGRNRCYLADPFGNRIELIEAIPPS